MTSPRLPPDWRFIAESSCVGHSPKVWAWVTLLHRPHSPCEFGDDFLLIYAGNLSVKEANMCRGHKTPTKAQRRSQSVSSKLFPDFFDTNTTEAKNMGF
jgi:hypothetical protein